MGDIADWLEGIDTDREHRAEATGIPYDPRWFFPSCNPPEPATTGHVCEDWPCAKCGNGF